MSRSKQWTMQAIVKASKKAGGYFFAPKTMKDFYSRLLKDAVFQGEGGIFFVIENRREQEHPPHYAIRKFNPETGSIDYPRHPYENRIEHLNSYGIKSRGFSDFNDVRAAKRYANRLSYNGNLEPQILYKLTGCILDGANGDEYNNKRLVEIAIEQGYTGDVKLGQEDGEFDHEIAEEIKEWLTEHCCLPELYLQFENGGDLLCMHEGVDYDDPDKTVEEQLEEIRAAGADLGDIDFAEEIKDAAVEGCYYEDPMCDGRLWTCATCKADFCSDVHHNKTEKGTNVECVNCERARLEGNQQ
jgi:hypothetical protein